MARKKWLATIMVSKKFTATMIALDLLCLILYAVMVILYATQGKWNIADKWFLGCLFWIVCIGLNYIALKTEKTDDNN